VNRRDVILALLALGSACKDARAQKQALIAVLSAGTAESSRRNVEQLVEGLRELGHVHGRTFRVEDGHWNGEAKLLAPLLSDLLAKKPDVLVVGGTTVVRAAKEATDSTPIVVANASDLVSSGVVRSYARPGGNLTGLTTLTNVMMAKRLEILVEAVPAARKVVLLQNPSHALAKSIESQTSKVAAALGVDLSTAYATDLRELEATLDKLGGTRADAVLVSPHALFLRYSSTLIERAMRQKVFVVHWLPHTAQQGALLVQGVDIAKQHRRAASYVDRILKGTRPGDLPIEQVTTDELIVNLKTAKALGLKLSQSVLLRADKVIQ
jgi:putative ABC transport system substrate-binding protein